MGGEEELQTCLVVAESLLAVSHTPLLDAYLTLRKGHMQGSEALSPMLAHLMAVTA